MGQTACGLVASLIDWIEGPHGDQGRPRCPTEAVVETLHFFLREGVQWRELRATGDRVCGATLRRRLMEWSAQDRKPRPQPGMWSSTAAACAPSTAAS